MTDLPSAPAPSTPGRVLITGGSSGLGAAVAHAVAEAGGSPINLDLVAPDGRDVPYYPVDVTHGAGVVEAVQLAAEEHGGLDAVVTAAGIDRCGALGEVPATEWERVVEVNLLGTVRTVRAALPHLTRSHGRVVTVASTLALRGVSDATAYCASKFGVLGFSRALAAETRGRLGVTTIIPGGMDTAFFEGRSEQYRPSDTSLLNDPANVARCIVFALGQPMGCEIRELLVAAEQEDSWP